MKGLAKCVERGVRSLDASYHADFHRWLFLFIHNPFSLSSAWLLCTISMSSGGYSHESKSVIKRTASIYTFNTFCLQTTKHLIFRIHDGHRRTSVISRQNSISIRSVGY
jgi:hypothetical protein